MSRVPFAQAETITRYAAGTRDAVGSYTPGAITTPTIRMCIQPMSSKSVTQSDQNLMERFGIRWIDGMMRVFVESAIYTDNKATGAAADRFTYDGQTYEMKAVQKWPPPRAHWHGIACLVDEKTS